jgi:hypothetical protein
MVLASAHPAVADVGLSFAGPIFSPKGGEDVVFTVKGIDPRGRAMTFACGTDEQAMERSWELQRRGFREIVVTDPKGNELPAAVFERSLEIDWD